MIGQNATVSLRLINDFRRGHVRHIVDLVEKYKRVDPELIRQVCSLVDMENEMIHYEINRHNEICDPGDEWEYEE